MGLREVLESVEPGQTVAWLSLRVQAADSGRFVIFMDSQATPSTPVVNQRFDVDGAQLFPDLGRHELLTQVSDRITAVLKALLAVTAPF